MNNCNCNGTPKATTVQTPEGLKSLANVVVHVVSNNTTYFVNSCHEMIVISSGDVYIDNYNAITNPVGLANQVCYDFANNVAYAFNALGEYRVINLKEVQA